MISAKGISSISCFLLLIVKWPFLPEWLQNNMVMRNVKDGKISYRVPGGSDTVYRHFNHGMTYPDISKFPWEWPVLHSLWSLLRSLRQIGDKCVERHTVLLGILQRPLGSPSRRKGTKSCWIRARVQGENIVRDTNVYRVDTCKNPWSLLWGGTAWRVHLDTCKPLSHYEATHLLSPG